jgi:hypothetical protein
MSERVVAVLLTANPALPPGLASAMTEDVIDLVSEMPRVAAAVVVGGGGQSHAVWPGTPVLAAPLGASAAQVLDVAATAYPDRPVAVAIVAGDAPDLPPLLIGKLFSPLGDAGPAQVAVCPAAGGGLVAIATGLPVPSWLATSGVGLNDAAALDRLQEIAPSRTLVLGPGWHRIRCVSDVSMLDPGLDGWDATRAHLFD